MKIARWVGVTGSVALVGAGLVTALVLNTEVPTPVAGATAPAGQPVAAHDAVQRALRAGKPTVAEFGANACAQCREMKPVLEALRREHGDRIAVVNVDLIAQREHNYIQRYGIQLMPTQIFFDAQGREIGRNLGKLTGEEILVRLQVAGTPATPPPAAQRATEGNPL
ncbi:MAG: thioredoxin domain-containing protein [Rubrivivax sp.]|nr:thioredoxin domain-containing protein [Rubrivivax sp.]